MLDVTLAQPRRRDALVVFPLVTADEAELSYALLSDALDAGTLVITEVGDGRVPELLAKNAGDADVLVLDGEQLVGAKQNRMTNRSILLPAGSETRITVACIERRRWRDDGASMSSAPQHSPSKVRRRARQIEADYAATGTAAPRDALGHAQRDVWADIAETADKLGGGSATGDLSDLYTARARELDEWAERFPAVDEQVGLLAFLGDRPLGMDVIGGRELYRRLHRRLLRGYILDALEGRGAAEGEVDGPAAQGWLDRVRDTRRVEAETVGRGTYRVLSGDVVGGELVAERRLVHLCAFPAHDGGGAGREDAAAGERPIARPSRRRVRYDDAPDRDAGL